MALEGNELKPGVVRVGGYSMSEIQERGSGILLELIFYIREMGGEIEITEIVDDLKDFVIQQSKTKVRQIKY